MPKKLIKKYQWGGISPSTDPYRLDYQTDIKNTTNYLINGVNTGFKDASKELKNKFRGSSDLMKMQRQALGIPANFSKKSKWTTGTTVGTDKKPLLSKLDAMGLVSQSPELIETSLQALGVEKGDMSGGEQVFSSISDIGMNPQLLAATGGLSAIPKALDLVNKYTGKTAKKEGTLGIDTGGYTVDVSTGAGKKQTLLGSNSWTTIVGGMMGGTTGALLGKELGKKLGIKSKLDRINERTAAVERSNLLKGNAAYQSNQNLSLADNTVDVLFSKNQQQLNGGINTNLLSAKKGTKINPVYLRSLTLKAKRNVKINTENLIDESIEQFAKGGEIKNVIPEGALHARKHNIQGEIADSITDKGIPVISFEDGGEITQHAEIEVNEIIFNKDTTNKLEDFFKQYNNAESELEKKKISIECGKFLTSEILENTDDRTGLLNTIE